MSQFGDFTLKSFIPVVKRMYLGRNAFYQTKLPQDCPSPCSRKSQTQPSVSIPRNWLVVFWCSFVFVFVFVFCTAYKYFLVFSNSDSSEISETYIRKIWRENKKNLKNCVQGSSSFMDWIFIGKTRRESWGSTVTISIAN